MLPIYYAIFAGIAIASCIANSNDISTKRQSSSLESSPIATLIESSTNESSSLTQQSTTKLSTTTTLSAIKPSTTQDSNNQQSTTLFITLLTTEPSTIGSSTSQQSTAALSTTTILATEPVTIELSTIKASTATSLTTGTIPSITTAVITTTAVINTDRITLATNTNTKSTTVAIIAPTNSYTTDYGPQTTQNCYRSGSNPIFPRIENVTKLITQYCQGIQQPTFNSSNNYNYAILSDTSDYVNNSTMFTIELNACNLDCNGQQAVVGDCVGIMESISEMCSADCWGGGYRHQDGLTYRYQKIGK
ncbi:hypothetical protein GGI42DRAFT_337126 [Trichoderma sp. SZMC 28013]